ncbi:hypothetical protein RUM44_003627 [Polyplax serrata]|uniref:Uncharacterized protein n=1 Tax=Polyplax serrata TaxID=468196 RepID=A0ABR1AH11_POLSC
MADATKEEEGTTTAEKSFRPGSVNLFEQQKKLNYGRRVNRQVGENQTGGKIDKNKQKKKKKEEKVKIGMVGEEFPASSTLTGLFSCLSERQNGRRRTTRWETRAADVNFPKRFGEFSRESAGAGAYPGGIKAGEEEEEEEEEGDETDRRFFTKTKRINRRAELFEISEINEGN